MKNEQFSVLQINVLGATLSTGRTTREMHNYFCEHGIKSYIACPTNKDCNDAFTFTSQNLMHIDAVLTKFTGLEAYHSRFQTRKLLKYIKRISPDVVHLRVLHGNCIHIGMLLKYLAKANIATVITLHDFWYMTGKCCFYSALDCKKWATGCGQCPALKSDRHPMLFDRTHYMWKKKNRWFSEIKKLAVVGVSDWVVNEAKQSFFAKHAKIIRRIYNWIDLSIFRPQDASALRSSLNLQNKFVILAISASWTPGNRKSFDTYLKLAEVMPTHYHIVLVGKMNYNKLLPNNISAIPQTNDTAELAQYYAMANVYLNLSLEETFGKVSAEAVSCGTPIVAYDATANREIVPENGGFLLDSMDTEKILDALKEVERNDKEHYIPICRRFAEENFNKETNIKEYLALYQELTNEG